ncbi:MAG TPA: NADP-dependent oxidoreductase [Puia sp.]|nr:NADP-dependent oxidoreductase [Puia sp.]
MKAIQIHSYGGPEVLKVEEVARPQVSSHDVLIKVYASGVNPLDWKAREGYMKHSLPFIPGWDVSGVVEETGPAVKNFKKGDEVYSRPDTKGNGSYAEYVVAKDDELGHKPATIDHVTAAAIPLAGLTAWQGLFTHGKLRQGQRVLILGASGGVGSFAVQFAKCKGAYVIGTTSEPNLSFIRELGADEAIDYHKRGYENLIGHIDMVFDTIGGEAQKNTLRLLRPGGILVTTLKVEDAAPFEKKGVRITGMMGKSRPEDLEAIARLVDEGKVKPFIQKVFPLEKAADASRMSQEGHVRGKIVLRVREDGA